MSARLRKDKRLGGEHEDYPTPGWCIDRLFDEVELPSGRWLEPCAGEGSIIRAVNLRRPKEISWTAVEIQDRRDSLRAAAKETGQPWSVHYVDFFKVIDDGSVRDVWKADRRWPFDVVIMNPPYTMAVEFIQECRALAPLVCVLLRLNFLESADRAASWRSGNMPERIDVLPDRPCFRNGSSDSCAYGWFTWTNRPCYSATTRVLATTPKAIRRPKAKQAAA